jgi:dTDP-4-amino-4,6-dideoxygalactose transaminase
LTNKPSAAYAPSSSAASDPIFVTRPSLPPLAELTPLLAEIWHSRVLTNGGKFHQLFERALCEYLGTPHVVLLANATLGLILALEYLGLHGEVITTPFSFVATGNALLWARLKPVFADIDPVTLNLSPESVAAAVTPRTKAILAVHCFGRPCNVEAIDEIAREHDLRVIYDAAHAFGVADSGGSVLRHGDLSVVSFHATKVFNTAEGGAIICPDRETKVALDRLVNHGKIDDQHVESVGMNAKMNEISAALGYVQLRHIDSEIAKRALVDRRYRELLRDIPGIQLFEKASAYRSNYYSFPVVVDEAVYGESRDGLCARLQEHGVLARRYFSPLISELPTFRDYPSSRARNLPSATSVAARILGLPMYPDLSAETQQEIAALLRRSK